LLVHGQGQRVGLANAEIGVDGTSVTAITAGVSTRIVDMLPLTVIGKFVLV
jgi:hypothetical protein